jgi:UDP-N-acetylglucosamine--N-acetylmuramyl-(pentapeptide) pyrophosphoryl-undecaprenol N-acetylglucosamine transferase
MRWIIAGGGTGGHLFPGLAVARELQRRDPVNEILFVGTDKGIESRVLPKEGFPLETLPVRGIKGRGLRGLAEALYGIPAGVVRALGVIRRFQPRCIIGLGGYASGPLLVAGWMKRLPCVIMEQNLRPGLTNRVLGRLVDRVFTSYSESSLYFPRRKVLETGNPVRWRGPAESKTTSGFTLLIFGGSAGAHKINLAAVDAIKELSDLAPDLNVIHQTGEADLAWVRDAYRSLPFAVEVVPFIDRMDEAYARADLLVCRAGATTIAELTALGKPAILVPYPYAAYDHQRSNAEALKKKGAAAMILDRELTGKKLAAEIRRLKDDPNALSLMGNAAKALGKADAAERIVEECYRLVQQQ